MAGEHIDIARDRQRGRGDHHARRRTVDRDQDKRRKGHGGRADENDPIVVSGCETRQNRQAVGMREQGREGHGEAIMPGGQQGLTNRFDPAQGLRQDKGSQRAAPWARSWSAAANPIRRASSAATSRSTTTASSTSEPSGAATRAIERRFGVTLDPEDFFDDIPLAELLERTRRAVQTQAQAAR